ncbi:MAG: flagellar motor switch phosphatase FliY [Lachnospiraceae bacterium]|nr:flagellar motor switch phosphatase FliY [Lachnospiraceae bacterium]
MKRTLNPEQIDVLGEISNISMGTAATTVSVIVNQPVDITVPHVSVINRSESLDDYDDVCVFVQIQYVKGLFGSNVFILKERDVLCLASLMMGGDGKTLDPAINEMHMSAISEAMNQMMGSSATSMSSMLDLPIDISTPECMKIDVRSIKFFEKMFATDNDLFVKIAFRMQVGDLIDSTMVQLFPIGFAGQMCEPFLRKIHS